MGNDPVKAIYRQGKKPKKILQPRAARHLGHPHELSNGADMHRHPMPDKGKTRSPKTSEITRHHGKMVEKNLEALIQAKPELARTENEIYAEKLAVIEHQDGEIPATPAKRAAYAALETHKEMASVILSAGGTFEEAADYAGVAPSTIRRYFEDDAFRARVEEQKSIVKSMVGGRILGSLDRLTEDPERLDNLAVRDRLALYDRFEPAGSGRDAKPTIGQQNNTLVVGSYDDLMALAARTRRGRSAPTEVDVDDARAQGSGFDIIEHSPFPVASRGTE